MKLSLITPAYNSAHTLTRTIESVLEQKYPNLEYIIVDGASTDDTRSIVESYKDKLNIIFISEPDNGIYDAMNKGIQKSTGNIIGVLNSDDFFNTSDILSDVEQAFENMKVEAVYGDISYFKTDTKKTTRYWKSGTYSESKLNNGWTIPHPALFVRKSVYERCGLFRTEYKIAADYEFILRILKIHKIQTLYIPKVFVRMYDGGTSGQNIDQRKIGWKELRKAWEDNNLSIPKLFITRRLISKVIQFLKK